MSEIITNTLIVEKDHIRFRVAAGNGEYIRFPVSFLSDKVMVIVPSYYDGNVFNTCGVTKQYVCDRYGFTLSKLAHNQGQTPFWNSSRDPVDVIVYGRLAQNPSSGSGGHCA